MSPVPLGSVPGAFGEMASETVGSGKPDQRLHGFSSKGVNRKT